MVMLLAGLAGCAGLPENVHRPPSHALALPAGTPLEALVAQRQADKAGSRADTGFLLLDSAERAFTSRLALVQQARKTLDLQYYAIHADATTRVLLTAVAEAAQRGVRVRVLLDDFNTGGDNAQVLRLAFVPNVEMRLFNPLVGTRDSTLMRIVTNLSDVDRMQQRMHNKLFLADNSWGITGGRNLGDAYFGEGQSSNFVDTDILAAGRVVQDLSSSFDRYWNDPKAYPVQSLVSEKELLRMRERAQQANAPSGEGAPPPAAPPDAPVAEPVPPPPIEQRPAMDLARVPLVWAPSTMMADKPGKIGAEGDEPPGDTVVDGLLGLIRQARQDLLIVSPYFVPGPDMLATFQSLRDRGVRVRVLTNSLASNDAPAAHVGYARHRPKLLAMGVELYEMRSEQPGSISAFGSSNAGGGSSLTGSGSKASLHSKMLVMDGRLIVVGSMNLDLRSQLQNTEIALVMRSQSLAGQATGQLEQTLRSGAYRVQQAPDGSLLWKAPPGARFADSQTEPDASLSLRILVKVLGPFAPDSML